MKIYSLIIVAFFTVVVSSCEKTVNVTIPYEGDKIVLNTFMRQDSFIYTQVTKSLKLSQNNNFTTPAGTMVQLYKNGSFVENMTAFNIYGNVFFKSSLPAAPNGIYTIKASATGLASVEGTDTLPSKANSTAISYKVVDLGNNDREDRIKIKINDPQGERNYYRVTIYTADTNTSATGPRYIIYDFKNRFTADITGANSGGFLGGDESREVLFTDEQFNGKEVVINISSGDNVGRNYRVIEVVALSKAAYRYIVSTNAQSNSSGDPFAEATIVYNNIINGFGIVAGTAAEIHILKKQ